MLWIFFGFTAFANDLPGEPIWEAPAMVSEAVSKDNTHRLGENLNTKKQVRRSKPEAANSVNSNLPTEYLSASARASTQSEIVLPKAGTTELFQGIRVGDVLEIGIPHSVIGFPDEKSPVLGLVASGALRGVRFIGESLLEPNTRRVFINFNRLVIGQNIYRFSGVAVSSEGQPGLIGEYYSREAEYFAGDFIASFAAGYFDGLVPRKTNVFGQTEVDSSVDSAVKKGLASGAMSTAERFREKLKKVPQFSELKGPFNIKLLVLEQATNK